MFKAIIRWIAVPFVVLPLPGVIYLFHKYPKYFKGDFKDQLGTAGWIFSSLVTIVALISLFVSISYEDKIASAKKNLHQVLHPYAIDIQGLKLAFAGYREDMSKDILFSLVYYVFVTVSFVLVGVCGITVAFFTQFTFHDKQPGTCLADCTLYGLWGVLTAFMTAMTILFNLIRNRKNPSSKGYLPSANKVFDVECLYTIEGDLSELCVRNCPVLEFYKNPSPRKGKTTSESHEMNVVVPIELLNLYFVIKLYGIDGSTLLCCYGGIAEPKSPGGTFFRNLERDFPETVYTKLDSGVWGEAKVYGKTKEDIQLLARIRLAYQRTTGNGHRFIPERQIMTGGKDHDIGYITNQLPDSLDFAEYTLNP